MFEGWLDRTEGRKTFCRGRLVQDGAITCEAEALFVRIDPEKMRTLGGATG